MSKSIIKEVWDNTSFRSYNIIRNLGKGGLITAILIPGIVLCFFSMQAEERELYLEKRMGHAIYEEWKVDNGDVYLDTSIPIRTFPFVFGKQENIEIVSEMLNTHNYIVRARRNNRAVGIYVDHNPNQEYRIEAFLQEDVIHLKSENVKKNIKGYKLPLRE